MSIHISTPAYTIAASATSSQRVQITGNTNSKFIRVVNGSASNPCFVNAGGSTVAATSSNVALAPLEARNFERDPNTQQYVAALMAASTGFVIVMPVNEVK